MPRMTHMLAAALLCGWMEVTAYSSGCGASGLTAAGTVPGPGTVAAPPGFAFGTELEIDGYPWPGVVLDRGGAIGPGRLDVFVPDCRAAREWGRRPVRVEWE